MPQHHRSFLTRNQLLAALGQDDFETLWPHLEYVVLSAKQVLFEPNTPIRYVHFIEAGICSMVATADEKPSVEIGMVGREGLVGLPLALSSETAPYQAIVQIAGSGLRMEAGEFRTLVEQRTALRALLQRYALAMMAQIAQTAACNGRHTIQNRLARWLLIAHDRVESDELLFTHEFLGQMLGVRRAGVTAAVQALERAGIIASGHGRLHIRDRTKLESAACDCYFTVRNDFIRLTDSSDAPKLSRIRENRAR
jgi:CRP-like cAMP-binding protein